MQPDHLSAYRALCASKRSEPLRAGISRTPELNATLRDHQRAGVDFFDARTGQCRWPLWGLTTPFAEKRFCGEPAPGPGPYCAYCRTLSYEPARSAA